MNQLNTSVLSPSAHTSTQDGIIGVDMNLRITEWNEVMARITGVSTQVCQGQPLFEAFPFLREINEDTYLSDALHGRSFSRTDRPYKLSPDGMRLTFEVDYSPCHDAAGNIIGARLLIHNFSA